MLTGTENPTILEYLIDSGGRKQKQCLELLERFNLKIIIERCRSYLGLMLT
jgi:hypothetical protein